MLALCFKALAQDGPPQLTAPPPSQTVPAGSIALFTVVVQGSEPLWYQWRRNGTNLVNGSRISGVDTATLALSNVQAGELGRYSVTVTNMHGTVTSPDAMLTLWPLVAWAIPWGAKPQCPGT